ncbi:MAG: DUF4956 domain-containing protein [Spirochaetales bacterium]
MLNELFAGIFDATSVVRITLSDFFICMITALILGIFMAKMYVFKTKSTKGFVATLALLPVVVAMVIIMVNGNIGTGVAVAGAFSLVRFRSVPGSAKEIAAIFTAMCTGLTVGMGYIGFAVVFAVLACTFALLLTSVRFGEQKNTSRILHITIPENLNYIDVFDDIFARFTCETNLIATKTTNMGSLFKLTYEIELKNIKTEKEFMDELRCRNGNLEIIITNQDLMINGL